MSTKRIRLAACLAALAAASLVLAGCGSAGSTTSNTASASNATLTIGQEGADVNFDPAAGSTTVINYLAPVYDTLIMRESDGSFHPNLATTWGYTSPTEFTLTLRTGVKFSDGSPLNAAAVVKNILHVKEGTGPLATDFSTVANVTAPDSTHVDITLSSPNPSLPIALSGVSGMIANPSAIDAGTLKTTPAGSGPYTLDKAATITNSKYVYTKRDDYWNSSHYHFKKIIVSVVTNSSSMVSAIKSGQLDLAELGTASDIARAKKIGLKFSGGSLNVWTLHLLDRSGTQVPAFASLKVRQALNYAVDRSAMVKSLNQGLGRPTDQLVKPGMAGYKASLDKTYPYNPEKAKQLLADAGYSKGFSFTAVSISLADTATQALQGYFSAIGVTMKVKDVPLDQYISEIVSGKYPAAFLPYGMVDAYYDFGQLVIPNAGFNPFHSSDSDINKLYKQAASEVDDSARDKTLQDLNARVVNLAWFVPLFDDAYGYVLSDRVSGVKWTTYRPPVYYDWKPAS